MADDANSKPTQQSERAKARWQLLRRAIVKSSSVSATTRTTTNKHSMHAFGGYNLLSPRPLSSQCARQVQLGLVQLIQDSQSVKDDLILAIEAWRAIGDKNSPHIDFVRKNEEEGPWTSEVLQHVRSCIPNVQIQVLSSQTTLRVQKKGSNSPYRIQEYRLPSNNNDDDSTTCSTRILLVREPRPNRTLPLSELVCHRQQQSVDNTGNICVWDAAQTLCWALQQERDMHQQSLLELGAGMGGLSALAAAASSNQTVIVTDGNESAVHNNRVNLMLNAAWNNNNNKSLNSAPPAAAATKQAVRLLWTTDLPDDTIPSFQVSCTAVADCVHFVQYHAALLWTAVYHTRIHGSIYFCQPHRGTLWERFATLIGVLADRGLLDCLRERFYPELERQHGWAMENDALYQPDIHRPHIFVLTKRRLEERADRAALLRRFDELQQQQL